MINEDFTFYVFCLLAFIVGIFILKKVASCLLKTVFTIVLIGLLVLYYFLR